MEDSPHSLKSLEVVSATLASNKSPAEMAECALDAVRTETGADATELFVWDAPTHEMSLAGHNGLFPDAFCQITRFPMGQGFPGLIAAYGQPVQTDRLSEDKRYLRTLVTEKGFRYYLCLPLKGEPGVLGCLNLASRGQPISMEASQFATIVSNGLALALERAHLRLWKDLTIPIVAMKGRVSLERLGALALEHMLTISHALGGGIFLPGEYGADARVADRGVCRESSPRTVRVPTCRDCQGCSWQRSVFPVGLAQGRSGYICLAYPPGEPVPDARAWLQLAASESATAIDWALSLQASCDTAVAAERRHLSQEIHDSLSQNLALIAQQAELASKFSVNDKKAARHELHTLRTTVRQSREEMHRVLHRMSPPEIARGLAAAINKLTVRLQRLHPLRIHLAILGEAEPPVQCHLALFRLVQEALTNVISHANASEVWVELDMRPPVLSIEIRDNGQGFDLAILRDEQRIGLGLRNMQERVESLGGVLTVQARPGQGASLRLAIPYPDRGQLKG